MSAPIPATPLLWLLKFLLVLLMAVLSRRPEAIAEDGKRHIQIVVLGDIGRSPRMQYHALSIAKQGGCVDLVGYQDSKLHPELLASNRIRIVPLSSFPAFLNTKSHALFAILGPLKVVFQVWTLWSMLLFKTRRPDWTLVQNPPSIPTLAVSVLVCWLRKSRLVIDWHNFGYSILSLKLGPRHPLVLLSSSYEDVFSRLAYAHICVTNAMARCLKESFHVNAPILTLYDRPASIFEPLDQQQRLDFMERVIAQFSTTSSHGTLIQLNTLCTASSPGTTSGLSATHHVLHVMKEATARLVVSSTSWTPDEDFTILLDALTGYCDAARDTTGAQLPDLVVMITGKGPEKASFEASVQKLHAEARLPKVSILTAYFEDVEDYARLLGSADLGVSLHTSSSGVDLPMKVLDMFGAGLPVVGWSDFEAWPELVQEGSNGLGFRSALQLQHKLQDVFAADSKLLQTLRKGALDEGTRRWDDEWMSVCGGLFDQSASKRGQKTKL